MNRPLLIKLGAIAVLMLLLLAPLLMIDGLVGERQAYRDGVLQDIARSSAYEQRLSGPLLVVPYVRSVLEWQHDEKTDTHVQVRREKRGRLYFLPERFVVDGNLTTELRHRGIYEARLYHAQSRIQGGFLVPANYGVSEDLDSYRFEQPFLAVGISDVRGIQNVPRLAFGGRQLDFAAGSGERLLGDGLHVALPIAPSSTEQRFDYGFDLNLLGSSRLAIAPVGRESQVNLSADWPHPSFDGEYLPTERSVDAKGFTANWRTSFFASGMEDALKDCVGEKNCNAFQGRSFGVSLIDPVDQYLKADRALKYALLFIGLTFAGFFLFEVLKGLALHPVQYALVGLALALFYLLLLSLTEHIGFELAYLASAGACVALIGFYLSTVLHSVLRGCAFAFGLALLYGALYGLLRAEDYALLMGSLLLFAVLAGVMALTRRLDWYGVGRQPEEPHFSLDEVSRVG